MIKWTKPSGLEVTTNDEPATVKYCESLKWERKKPTKKRKKEVTP